MSTLTTDDLANMLECASRKIRANHEMLTKLDSVIGDGDHGTAMLRSMDAVETELAKEPRPEAAQLLTNLGWAVMSAAGGSTGPLLGSFFLGMGETPTEAAGLLSAAIKRVHQQSKAQVGDKTMMDALLPALQEIEGAPADCPAAELMRRAAAAAAAGAEATQDMRAKFGRARNLGDRVLGHRDPGAVSLSLILAGFAEALTDH